MPKEEKIHEQYCIFEEILIMIAQGRATGQIFEYAKNGISITIGDWRKKTQSLFIQFNRSRAIVNNISLF
ncbi:MAG: hypothetical protein HFH77_05230 [Lachnospiraceae bacterium]|nr:hypothetical protein [Lachnospiraceae bacterium]